jgi:HSP20 family molecular chaperone IbpA
MYIPKKINCFEDSFLDDYKNMPIMNADIIESDHGYELQIDLPGVKKEDIKIDIDEGILNISASISGENEENRNYIRKERFKGEVKRSFSIDENILENDINASFENGVLYLNLPKKEEKNNNKKIIEIN